LFWSQPVNGNNSCSPHKEILRQPSALIIVTTHTMTLQSKQYSSTVNAKPKTKSISRTTPLVYLNIFESSFTFYAKSLQTQCNATMSVRIYILLYLKNQKMHE
jgi:hypothetical protein